MFVCLFVCLLQCRVGKSPRGACVQVDAAKRRREHISELDARRVSQHALDGHRHGARHRDEQALRASQQVRQQVRHDRRGGGHARLQREQGRRPGEPHAHQAHTHQVRRREQSVSTARHLQGMGEPHCGRIL